MFVLMILRLSLALVFMFYAFTTPVGTACVSYDNACAECCCAHMDTSECSIGGSCCTPEPKGDSTPQAHHSFPYSAFTVVALAIESPADFKRDFKVASIGQFPTHLGSNKLYLKKRALLI
jgi:hypothetical protein